MTTTVSEYCSDDKTKKAIVKKINDRNYDSIYGYYYIDIYENERYIHSITFPDNSLHYVEDAAENYVRGAFTNIKDF